MSDKLIFTIKPCREGFQLDGPGMVRASKFKELSRARALAEHLSGSKGGEFVVLDQNQRTVSRESLKRRLAYGDRQTFP